MTRPQPEDVIYGTPRHAALCRAFTLANIDLSNVSIYGIAVYRNHIEYDEFQRDKALQKILDLRDPGWRTKRRVIRNPNPRLAP